MRISHPPRPIPPGWAIEGAIGSEFKIDASYLSPHVNMASRLEAATKQVLGLRSHRAFICWVLGVKVKACRLGAATNQVHWSGESLGCTAVESQGCIA